MRYSRFKKQIEGGGTTSTRRPRATPASPKVPRGPKKEKGPDSPNKRVKTERKASGSGGDVGVKSKPSHDQTSTPMTNGDENMQHSVERSDSCNLYGEIKVKPEPGLRSNHGIRASSLIYQQPTPNPSTSGGLYSPSPSPSLSANHSFQTSISDMELMSSFNMNVPYSPTTASYLTAHHSYDGSASVSRNEYPGGGHEYGSLLNGMEINNDGSGVEAYDIWGQASSHHTSAAGPSFKGEDMESGNGSVLVKTEPRWEDAYHHV